MNIINQLAERATLHPERIALIDSQRSINYSELYQEVCHGSELLLGSGLSTGDCVLILEPISINLYIHLLAVFHAGMTVMLIDPSAGKAMMQNSLKLNQPDGFIGIPKAHLLRVAVKGIRQIKHRFHTHGWVPFSKKWKHCLTSYQKANRPTPTQVTSDAPALVTFTSGSTGMPKAACRTHGFLIAQHTALSKSLDFQEAEVDLITLPVFAIANLASGMTSVIADTDLRVPAEADSPAILQQCKSYQVTRCAASPAFFLKLYQDQCLTHFKTIYTGGAPVFPHLLDAIQTDHPELKIITVYGSTEAEPISHIAWDEVTANDHEAMKSGKGLLVGKPVPEIDVMIFQERDNEMKPSVGQIAVTGEHVLKGYLNGVGDEETKINHKGIIWHLTGDMGYFDKAGRLWLMGRESAVFEIDQRIIYPFSIECAVMHSPIVTRCAVIQYEGRNLLCIESSTTEIEPIKSHFSEYNFLEFILLDSIPMDRRHNAKVDYPALNTILDQYQH